MSKLFRNVPIVSFLEMSQAELLRKTRGRRVFGPPSPDVHHIAIYAWRRFGDSNIWMMENF